MRRIEGNTHVHRCHSTLLTAAGLSPQRVFFPLLYHLGLSFRMLLWCHKHTIPQLLLTQVSAAQWWYYVWLFPLAMLNSQWGPSSSAQNQYSGAKLLISRKKSRGPDTWTSSRNECNWGGYATRNSTGTKLNSGRRKERKGSWEQWSRLLSPVMNSGKLVSLSRCSQFI